MSTVLVIEDDVAIAELLQAVLEGEGYRVLVSVDGRDGLWKAHLEHPNLVLCDIMLPIFNGFEVAMAIHLDPAILTTTPVVLMSAGLRPLPCQDGSWEAFLEKPFTLEGVVSMVAQHLHAA